MLSRDRMKQLSTPKEREMPVPLLGESVRIKLFRKGDIDAMRAESLAAGEVDNAKFERLLRETNVPAGLLCNGTHLRLVYAPRGESSGHITFSVADMVKVAVPSGPPACTSTR